MNPGFAQFKYYLFYQNILRLLKSYQKLNSELNFLLKSFILSKKGNNFMGKFDQ